MQDETEIRDWAELHGQAEEGQECIALNLMHVFVAILYFNGAEMSVFADELLNLPHGEIHFFILDEGTHFVDAVWVSTELISAVDQAHAIRHRL